MTSTCKTTIIPWKSEQQLTLKDISQLCEVHVHYDDVLSAPNRVHHDLPSTMRQKQDSTLLDTMIANWQPYSSCNAHV
eukprot:14579-Heterococcus_DN1.PRE.1